MSVKSKVAAAAATLTMVGGVGMAGALSAGTAAAATPSCGPSCINVFSNQFGTHKSPNFAVDVLRQGERAGQPIILFRTANYDPALDWTVAFQGTVSDFHAAGLVSGALDLHYWFLPAFENEYAPFGVDSGLCLGVATAAFNDEGVTLQPCGVSANTVWVLDYRDSMEHLHPRRLRPADQRLGHQFLPPVGADLPEHPVPDRQAASAGRRDQPDRFLQRSERSGTGHRE